MTDEVEVEVVQESNIMGINSQLGNKQQPSIEVQRVGEIQNSNLEPNQVIPIPSPAGSDHSVAITKSLGCSHNLCLDEHMIIKTAQEQRASTFNDKANSAQRNEKAIWEDVAQINKSSSANSSPSGPPPGFEFAGNYSKVVPDNTPMNENSKQSLGSAEKLAKEALQIGNLLGLKKESQEH